MKKFSLVSTVFNEYKRLDQTIQDIENQTVKPDEVIITDAGSKDGTFEKLMEWKNRSRLNIIILQKIKCNVAQGRNLAIQNAKNEIIVSTDFGCRFHPQWLESIIEPFNDNSTKVVGGAFTVDEEEIKSLSSKAAYILSNGYLCSLDETFIPSSRSIAYYKEIWEQVGEYPEWLTLAADDLVFGLILKKKNIPIHLVEKPYVYWGRHNKSEAYAKEAFRYGLGDGEAQVNLRNLISNGIESILRWSFILIFPLGLLLIDLVPFNYAYLLIFIPFLFGFRSYKNTIKNWIRLKSRKYGLKPLLFSFFLIEVTRFNYIRGYIKGLTKKTEEQITGLAKLKATL